MMRNPREKLLFVSHAAVRKRFKSDKLIGGYLLFTILVLRRGRCDTHKSHLPLKIF